MIVSWKTLTFKVIPQQYDIWMGDWFREVFLRQFMPHNKYEPIRVKLIDVTHCYASSKYSNDQINTAPTQNIASPDRQSSLGIWLDSGSI